MLGECVCGGGLLVLSAFVEGASWYWASVCGGACWYWVSVCVEGLASDG